MSDHRRVITPASISASIPASVPAPSISTSHDGTGPPPTIPSTPTVGKRTSHACDRCRRMRTKCLGGPRCARCIKDDAVCTYGDRKRERNKRDLVQSQNRIRSLQERNNNLARALRRLAPNIALHGELRAQLEEVLAKNSGEGSELGESEFHSQIQSSRANSPPNETWFLHALGHETTDTNFSDIRLEDRPQLSYEMHDISRLSGESQRLLMGDEDLSGPQCLPSSWTETTTNDSLVQHLLALYFCWEYPTFASMSKEHLLVDYRSGKHRFCSPLLVNAILAIGARFSDLPEAFKDPNDPSSAGQHFFEEAQRLSGLEEIPSLTILQALGLMSLRQASCGNDMSGWHYSRLAMRMAIDLDLHKDEASLDDPKDDTYSLPERQVRAATFWGCWTLEQAWSLCIGRPPQLAPRKIKVSKLIAIDEMEREEWCPYTDQGLMWDSALHQKGNVLSVYKDFVDLSEVVSTTVYSFYSDESPVTGHIILAHYTEYLQWYENLPDHLRLGTDSTPSVLFTHMYFHFAVLLLFRPFINLKIMGSSVSPRSICIEAARNILSLVKAYKDLYTLRRTPSFVPYLILTARLIAMMETPLEEAGGGFPKADATTYRGIEFLNELASSHGFARRAISICELFGQAWNLGIERDMDYDSREERENIKNNHGFGLDWPHVWTFFRPDTNLKRLYRGVSSSVARRSRPSARLSFHLFPLQDDPLRKVHDVHNQVMREQYPTDRLRKELEAHGFEEL